MHRFIINATLLTLCNSDMFRPLKSHLQGVQLIYFNSTVNTMSYRM